MITGKSRMLAVAHDEQVQRNETLDLTEWVGAYQNLTGK